MTQFIFELRYMESFCLWLVPGGEVISFSRPFFGIFFGFSARWATTIMQGVFHSRFLLKGISMSATTETTWTKEQGQECLESWWKNNGVATCGKYCGSHVTVKFARGNSGPILDWTFIASCDRPGCGGITLKKADDPAYSHFRPWTKAEGEQLIANKLNQKETHCPVDQVKVEVKQSGLDGGKTLFNVECRRCNAGFTQIHDAKGKVVA